MCVYVCECLLYTCMLITKMKVCFQIILQFPPNWFHISFNCVYNTDSTWHKLGEHPHRQKVPRGNELKFIQHRRIGSDRNNWKWNYDVVCAQHHTQSFISRIVCKIIYSHNYIIWMVENAFLLSALELLYLQMEQPAPFNFAHHSSSTTYLYSTLADFAISTFGWKKWGIETVNIKYYSWARYFNTLHCLLLAPQCLKMDHWTQFGRTDKLVCFEKKSR